MRKLEKALFIPDPHIPENDKKVTNIIFKIAKWLKPDVCFVMGDVLDAKTVSRYAKDPDVEFDMQDEFDLVNLFFKDVRKVVGPDCRIVWLLGNHEARWKAYLNGRAPEIANLRALQLQNLIDLEKDIEIVPYNKGTKYRGLHVEHGLLVSGKSGYTAHRNLDKKKMSGVNGHTHRLGIVYNRCEAGELYWAEVGTMQRKDPDYAKETTNWQWGCAITYWQEGWKQPKMDLVHIDDDHNCCYAGVVFS